MSKRLVQRIYASYKNKDLREILEMQHDDADWSVAAPPDKIPWASPGRGHKGVSNFLKILGDWLVPEAFHIEQYFESEDKVVTLGFQAGYIRPTGDHYEYDFVHVWEFQNGKVVKFRVYFDTAYVAHMLTGETKTAV